MRRDIFDLGRRRKTKLGPKGMSPMPDLYRDF